MSGQTKTRRYRKRKRAIQEEETRERITEAVVELHGSVGPAKTTVTEIAERAGVSRMTVYNHFPDEEALFAACSSHWIARNPFPDPAAWSAVTDPGERVHVALSELYRWYGSTRDMMDNVLRDAALVPAVGNVMDQAWWPFVERMIDVLAEGWSSPERRAGLRLLVDFRTWQALAAAGLGEARAAALAARMVSCPDPT